MTLMVRSASSRVSNHEDDHFRSFETRPRGRSSEPDRKSNQYFRALSNHLKMIHFSSWPGHSRPKDGVASARLCPGHPRLPYLSAAKTWMPGIADKFTQSAQGSLLRPGMTSFAIETDFIGCFLSQTLRMRFSPYGNSAICS